MRASAYPKLLPAVVGAALLTAAAPAVAAPAPSADTTTCGAVAHIGDGLSKDSLKDLESAYEKIGVPADSIHIDGAEGRGALSAKEGTTSGVQAITELVEATETEPPIPGGRCWVIAVGSDDLDGEADPDEMVRDVIGAVPHDERVMWINVDGDGDPVKSFNDALVAMEGEYAQTRVADWAGADGGDDPAKFGAFAAAELLDMTRAGAVDPKSSSGREAPAAPPEKDDAPAAPPEKDDAPAAPATSTTPDAPPDTSTTPAAPPATSTTPAAPPATSTTPAAPPATSTTPAAPPATSTTPAAPATPAAPPAAPEAPEPAPEATPEPPAEPDVDPAVRDAARRALGLYKEIGTRGNLKDLAPFWEALAGDREMADAIGTAIGTPLGDPVEQPHSGPTWVGGRTTAVLTTPGTKGCTEKEPGRVNDVGYGNYHCISVFSGSPEEVEARIAEWSELKDKPSNDPARRAFLEKHVEVSNSYNEPTPETNERRIAVLNEMAAVHELANPSAAPEAPAAPPEKDDAPATPAAPPAGPSAPQPGTEEATGDLQKSFDEMQKSVNGTLGLAIAPVDGDATSFGKLTNDVAWSTSKVPVAIAALRDGSGSEDNVAAAITKSDNDAAKALWSGLGADAAQKAGAVLVEGGDKTTKVQDKVVRAGFTPFGQTQWSMADAATFGAGLSKMDDPAATTVKGYMGNIAAGQDYGLGKIPGSLYKGGWGPNEEGGYLVRQFGIIELDGAKFGVAIGVKTSSGGYEEASPALNTVAQWIQDNKAGLTGKGANTDAPATGAAPAAEVTPVSATAGRDGGQDTLSGKTIWIDAGHAAQTRPGETVTDPKTGAVKECYTSGTASDDGWKEHTFNWEFTQALKAELESRGAKVELGRDDDTGTYECHDKRVAEENESDADLVISVHADGSAAGNRGFHIIHSDSPTPGSKEAAVAARDSLVEAGFTTSNYLGTDGIDARGDLYGLNNTTKAKILLEMGNMKDPTDIALLKDPEQRKKMASAIANSLAA